MEEQVFQERAPLSVSAAMNLAKGALEALTVKLVGEISEFSNKAGYKAVYFSVKDAQASLPCMMWINRYQSLGIELKVGMLVELTGRFTLYAPKGRMNFDVFGIEIAGEGKLRLQVANLAKKLQAEGLMLSEKKRALPLFPERIGLVTSPRGAAVHDVLRTLRRRFPLAQILLAGVPVEGENAPAGLVEALHSVEAAGAEVVLIVRGGGSFEDLMPFNDEGLARAIAGASVPVVTGIGHEPDTCIADMVADLRASTPTAAAEAVSPAPEFVEGLFEARKNTLYSGATRRIEREMLAVANIATRPMFSDPQMLFATEAQMLDVASERLHRAIPLNIERDKVALDRMLNRLAGSGKTLLGRFESRFSLSASRLHDLSPLIILGRGYSIARNNEGSVLKSIAGVKEADAIKVELADGILGCCVNSVSYIEKSTINWED